jgi:DNA mismatch endonuclease (patch repair protein)
MKLLRRHHFSGWRRHWPILLPAGDAAFRPRVKPDFVFLRVRIAIFIDGCFWHGCPVHGTRPRANAKFWHAKLTGNRERDRYVNNALRRKKWTVLRIWEHQLHEADGLVLHLESMFALAGKSHQKS